MYNSYFGFSDSPFENNLDQRFLFFSANHKEVTAALLYFIKWKKGFAMVCGDVGTGKTMLITYLLSRLPDSVHPVMISNPDVGYFEILQFLAGILKIDAEGKKGLELVGQVKEALVEAVGRGESFVLIIDEAHLLSDRNIEQIRLLSNIETSKQKLLQILLLGQYELSHKLSRPELRQLRQRISINRFLAPMDAAETIQYIDHRLKMAGSSFDACFEPQCKGLIFKLTKGVPRSINQLCDSALMVCVTENLQKVNRKVLKKAAADLQSDILFMPGSRASRTIPIWKTIRLLAGFGASAFIGAMFGLYGYQGGLGERTQQFLLRYYPPVPALSISLKATVSETASKEEMPPAAIKPISPNLGPLPGPAIDTPSEVTKSSSILPPSNDTIKEEALPALPKTIAEPEKGAILPSAEGQMRASGLQTAENKDSESDSGASLPEVKQSQPIETPVPTDKTVGNVSISPLLSGKSTQSKMQASVFRSPRTVVVKKGDTLIGIASIFFPENKTAGVKKIIAANPLVVDTNRIYAGQKLIVP